MLRRLTSTITKALQLVTLSPSTIAATELSSYFGDLLAVGLFPSEGIEFLVRVAAWVLELLAQSTHVSNFSVSCSVKYAWEGFLLLEQRDVFLPRVRYD